MSKKHFQQGLILYKNGDLQQALEQFNKAIDNGAQDNYLMLDTRAAVYAKLGETKKALKDAKKTIEVAPDQWQGYSRAAQLFITVNKPEASLTMVKLGLSKLKEEHTERRASCCRWKQKHWRPKRTRSDAGESALTTWETFRRAVWRNC
ncbi:hypothetical protein BJ912DRAFT_694357 [Pholiota molesta]|nr:hypothetical protein BJ912DRAFT_694357 [Pholiota molesta]